MADRHIVVYDIARAVAVLLVLAGHSGYYSVMMTPYGGIDYQSAMQAAGIADTAIHMRAGIVIDGIYTFHMRVFFALSGAVFFLRFQQGAYQDLRAFLKKKARRLLVPFFIVTTCCVVPLKYLAGYWDGHPHLLHDVFVSQYLLLDNHLWFLVILFLAFLAWGTVLASSSTLRRFLSQVHPLRTELIVFAGVMLFLFVWDTFSQFLMAGMRQHGYGGFTNLGLLVEFFGWGLAWMAVGMMMEKLRHRLPVQHGSTSRAAMLTVVLLCLFVAADLARGELPFPGGHRGIALREAWLLGVTMLGVAMTFALSYCLASTRLAASHSLQQFSRDSMGIYLYSDPWNYIFLAIFVAAFGLQGFGVPELATMLLIGRFFLTLIFSWCVTLLSRRFSRAVQFL